MINLVFPTFPIIHVLSTSSWDTNDTPGVQISMLKKVMLCYLQQGMYVYTKKTQQHTTGKATKSQSQPASVADRWDEHPQTRCIYMSKIHLIDYSYFRLKDTTMQSANQPRRRLEGNWGQWLLCSDLAGTTFSIDWQKSMKLRETSCGQ